MIENHFFIWLIWKKSVPLQKKIIIKMVRIEIKGLGACMTKDHLDLCMQYQCEYFVHPDVSITFNGKNIRGYVGCEYDNFLSHFDKKYMVRGLFDNSYQSTSIFEIDSDFFDPQFLQLIIEEDAFDDVPYGIHMGCVKYGGKLIHAKQRIWSFSFEDKGKYEIMVKDPLHHVWESKGIWLDNYDYFLQLRKELYGY